MGQKGEPSESLREHENTSGTGWFGLRQGCWVIVTLVSDTTRAAPSAYGHLVVASCLQLATRFARRRLAVATSGVPVTRLLNVGDSGMNRTVSLTPCFGEDLGLLEPSRQVVQTSFQVSQMPEYLREWPSQGGCQGKLSNAGAWLTEDPAISPSLMLHVELCSWRSGSWS